MTNTTESETGADLDLDEINQRLESSDAAAIVRWAADHFSTGLVMTSSFGAQAAVMLHLVTQVVPDVPVIFIDTGYLFPETYVFAEQLTQRLKLNLKVYQSPISPARMEALHGRLWEQGIDGMNQYDQLRKVEPNERALQELNATAWLSGLRRGQTQLRSTMRVVERRADGLYKVQPILTWHTRQVHEYLTRHDLPYHPLYEQGYVSLGDHHSTRPITAGEDERAGRFGGLKQECGIHLPQSHEESASRDSSSL